MSVVKGDRTEGKLEVLVAMKELATYTLTIVNNEKNFPKRWRWIITEPLNRYAVSIYANGRAANAVVVRTIDDYRLRRRYQVECRSQLESLLGIIELAYEVMKFDSGKLEHWTGLCVRCMGLLSKWRDSDRKRYSEIIKDSNG